MFYCLEIYTALPSIQTMAIEKNREMKNRSTHSINLSFGSNSFVITMVWLSEVIAQEWNYMYIKFCMFSLQYILKIYTYVCKIVNMFGMGFDVVLFEVLFCFS